MKTQKLTKKQRKEIAYEEYGKIQVIAYKKYEKINKPALKEYQKIVNPVYKEYEKIRKLAWKEYKKKCKEIDNEPEEVEEIIEHKGRKYKLVEELAK